VRKIGHRITGFALTVASVSGIGPACAALPQGAEAPDFSVPTTQGRETATFSLRDALRKGPVALYFFRSARSDRSIVEAREFAEAAKDFKAAGATLIGLSPEPLDRLSKLSTDVGRSKFPMGTVSAKILSDYGIHWPDKRPFSEMAYSYVITPDGKVRETLAAVLPGRHIVKSLETVKHLR
jgi:peroxiredoxin